VAARPSTPAGAPRGPGGALYPSLGMVGEARPYAPAGSPDPPAEELPRGPGQALTPGSEGGARGGPTGVGNGGAEH
jgi:hypothetical protein